MIVKEKFKFYDKIPIQMKKRSSNIVISQASKLFNNGISKKTLIISLIIVGIIFVILFLYIPAKNYYFAARENDKLNAQYEALKQTNQDLKDDIEFLKTPEGIKQRANDSLGLIQQGEQTGVVKGTAENSKADDTAATTSSRLAYKNVKAPDTWCSGFLDFFFGYKK